MPAKKVGYLVYFFVLHPMHTNAIREGKNGRRGKRGTRLREVLVNAYEIT